MRRAVISAAVAAFLLPVIAAASASPAQGAGSRGGSGGDAWSSTGGGTTGRLLVTLRPAGRRAQASAVRAVAAAAGVRAHDAIPQLRSVSLTPRAGMSAAALAARLRADPRVASVRAERRFSLRYVPNDPGFSATERGPQGTTPQWWALRENLPAAWEIARGDGVKIAVIDTGVDASHPEFAGRILAAEDFDAETTHGAATVDEVGHGTHVASLACAASDNAMGIAGAGLGCQLLIAKTDLSETSVARAVVWATENGADAINMSFGTDGSVPASDTIVSALRYAVQHNVILVAAAADDPTQEQGDPANVLQPTGSAPDIQQGLGLSVTAANGEDQRATFAGLGSQVSLAAYGTYGSGGPQGILGAFPLNATDLERGTFTPPTPACRCRTVFGDDGRYAYLQGTSMAAPVVAAVAGIIRHFNPDLSAGEVTRTLKQTARRPLQNGWTADLGWGILDAGAALRAVRKMDRRAPQSRLDPPRVTGRSISLGWTGNDTAAPGVVSAGISRYEVWRSVNGERAKRYRVTRHTSLHIRGSRGSRYSFYTVAVDKAGNREAAPLQPDARVRVAVRASSART